MVQRLVAFVILLAALAGVAHWANDEDALPPRPAPAPPDEPRPDPAPRAPEPPVERPRTPPPEPEGQGLLDVLLG